MNKVFLLLVCLVVITDVSAHAYVYGGTNFSFSGYPQHSCYLYDNSDKWYREDYIRCINEYIENASNDIKRIKEQAQETADEAKRKLIYGY